MSDYEQGEISRNLLIAEVTQLHGQRVRFANLRAAMNNENSTDTAVPSPALLDLAASIVSAYVTRNAVTAAELPTFIAAIYSNIARIATGSVALAVEPPKEPAVSIRKSVTDHHIICLEDGKKFKSLKRHLATNHGITPQEYRKKWGLPVDYPMVAPGYAAVRSNLAKQAGLGQKSEAPKTATKKKKSKS